MTSRNERIWPAWGRTLAVGLSCLLAGIILASGLNWTACARAEKPAAEALAINPAAQSPFVAVAKKVGPSVVNIRTRKVVEMRGYDIQGPFDDFFREFFGEVPRREAPKRNIEGQGSGFIIDKKGLVLTNNHVVAGGGELTVKLSDDREFKAEVVGADPRTDVAVIRLKDLKKDLPEAEVAELGNSDEIEVGDYAIAIGNPFGLERTVTQGIVSFKGRSGLPIAGGGPVYQDFIQTDASINYGNSGGPLVNIRGQVIGINTAINPAGQGIGFAIPINMARRVADQLIDKGKVVRGYLGVVPQEVTTELAEGLGLKSGAGGVIVASVQEESPASQAGLEQGDVIIRFDGKEVSGVDKFRQMVAETKVGAKVELVVVRNRKEQKIKATIGELPDETTLKQEPAKEDSPWLGIKRVLAVNAPEAQQMGIREKQGVVIREVEPGSPADEAGLRAGDVIKKVDDRTIKGMDDYLAASKGGEGRTRVLLIKRGENMYFVAVKP
jgi:serine protease Do